MANYVFAKEDCKICKFTIKHTPNKIVIYKWICKTMSYLKFGVIYYKSCPTMLKRLIAMDNGAEFIGIYSPSTGLKNIYEVL